MIIMMFITPRSSLASLSMIAGTEVLRLSIVLETSWNACDRLTTALIVLFTRVLTVDCNCIFLATLDHTLSNGQTCLRRLFSKTPKMIKGKNWSFFSFLFYKFSTISLLAPPCLNDVLDVQMSSNNLPLSTFLGE